MGWIRLRIQNMETRRPDAWDDKITTLDMRMRRVGAQTRATGIPAKVMKLISYGEIRLSNDPSVICGLRVHVNDHHVVGAFASGIKARYVGQLLLRRLGR